jgi:Co/Zn/Cd efflux system component
VADLHLWSVGPGLFAAELVIIADEPEVADTYRRRLDDLGLAHVVIETRPCAGMAC